MINIALLKDIKAKFKVNLALLILFNINITLV